MDSGGVLRHSYNNLCPRSWSRLNDQAVLVAERRAQSPVHVGQSDGVHGHVAGKRPSYPFWILTQAVVLHRDDALAVEVFGDDRDLSRARLALEAVTYGVLDQRLQCKERYDDGEDLRRDPQGDLQPVSEPRLLQH